MVSLARWVILSIGVTLSGLEAVHASRLLSATLADAHWIAALQEQETRHVRKDERARSYYHLSQALRHDPSYFPIYAYGGAYLAVIRNDKEGAQEILERGETYRRQELPKRSVAYQNRFWRDAWQIPLTLAYVHLFEWNDLARASEYFRCTSEIPSAPDFTRALHTRLSQTLGPYDVGRRLLQQMLAGARDPEWRRTLEQRLRHLDVAAFLAEQRLRLREKKPIATRDPWGGRVNRTPQGHLETTTPYDPVLGLDPNVLVP